MTSPRDLPQGRAPSAIQQEPIHTSLVGWLVGIDGAGLPLVDFHGNPAGPCVARRTISLQPGSLHRAAADRQRVVLLFENGIPRLPLSIGLVQTGSAITLRRNGKLILKGAYVETHSTGVNRIKGGSVQIN